MPFIPLNFSDILRNMTMEVHYWISKESQLLKRADVFETLYMTPQSLGLQPSEEENMAVRMSSTTSVVFDGFNESVNTFCRPRPALLSSSICHLILRARRLQSLYWIRTD